MGRRMGVGAGHRGAVSGCKPWRRRVFLTVWYNRFRMEGMVCDILLLQARARTMTGPAHNPEHSGRREPHGAARGDVTVLLSRVEKGDRQATEELFPVVYAELRELAERFLAGERKNHTLQPTALVHEAYLRLVGPEASWESRAHFFGAAATAIRRILTDHARSRDRLKRGGGKKPVPLEGADVAVECAEEHDLVGLDEALTSLARLDAQKARVVELRFFGGLSIEQTATVLGVSNSTVIRDWQFAKVWLHRELTKTG